MVAPNLSDRTVAGVLLHEVTHSQQSAALDARAMALIDGRTKQAPALRDFLDRVARRMEAAGGKGSATESMPYLVEQAVTEGRQAGQQRMGADWMEGEPGCERGRK